MRLSVFKFLGKILIHIDPMQRSIGRLYVLNMSILIFGPVPVLMCRNNEYFIVVVLIDMALMCFVTFNLLSM